MRLISSLGFFGNNSSFPSVTLNAVWRLCDMLFVQSLCVVSKNCKYRMNWYTYTAKNYDKGVFEKQMRQRILKEG